MNENQGNNQQSNHGQSADEHQGNDRPTQQLPTPGEDQGDKPSFKHRVLGMRSVAAVALASLIIGGAGGVAIGAAADGGNGRHGQFPGRDGFPQGQFPGQPGQGRNGQQWQPGQQPGQQPNTQQDQQNQQGQSDDSTQSNSDT